MTISWPDTDGALGLAELEQKLQIARGQRVAIINAPANSTLRLAPAAQPQPNRADIVIAFATRRVDLAWLKPAYAAAHATRVVWVVYPKPGQPGSDLRWEWLIGALRQYGVNAVEELSINHVWSALRLRPSGGIHESVGLGDHDPVSIGHVR